MKTCSTCGLLKSLDEFYRHPTTKDRKQYRCKECTSISSVVSHRKRHKKIGDFVRNYKETNPCKDCGQYFPYYVMDFDHLRDKVFMLSNMLRYSFKRVKEEIEKCELVCSNCHRIRTYIRSHH